MSLVILIGDQATISISVFRHANRPVEWSRWAQNGPKSRSGEGQVLGVTDWALDFHKLGSAAECRLFTKATPEADRPHPALIFTKFGCSFLGQ